MSEAESFPDYIDATSETEPGFHAFVLVYSISCFLLIAPLVIWGRKYQREREAARVLSGLYQYNQQNEFAVEFPPEHPRPQEVHPIPRTSGPDVESPSVFQDPRIRQPVYAPRAAPIRNVFRGVDKMTAVYPDEDPDFISQISGSQVRGVRNNAPSATPSNDHSRGQASQIGQQSNAPSAATTSRLYQRQSQIPKTQVWDVHARRWKQRRPIGRPHVIQKAIRDETDSMGGSSQQTERRRLTRSRFAPQNIRMHGVSDAASSILTDDLEGPPMQHQHRIIVHYRNRRSIRDAGSSSVASSSDLPDVIDDISPNDAADAGDPGRVNSFEEVPSPELTVCCGPAALWKPNTILAACDGLVELAEPDLEMKRILEIGLPLTLGAMSTTFFHLVTVTFIANFISTDAMVAYVIVHLVLGFTNELVGAISDAESTLCAHALSTGNWLIAGQYAQISIILVVGVYLPLLLMWGLVMDDLVLWLVNSESIAEQAHEYTKVILTNQLIQGISRTLTVLFHLTGNEKFETRFSLAEGVVSLIAVTSVTALAENSSLVTVGGVQLVIGAAAFVAKMAYALLRGWLRVFLKGLVRKCAITNTEAVCTMIATTIPLLVGAFLEYGEWEILLFFVVNLGPAEVATWALVGIIWKLLETSTEGFGEAAAIRVAYHLGSGSAQLARLASHKALLISTLQSLFITSILLMAGKNIANILVPDPTLQELLNNLIINVSLGNIVMSFAMSVWSLLGAQGRYRLATLVILICRWIITIPMALTCVFLFDYDLNSVMGSVTTGFATSVLALSYIFFRSDWERLSRIMQELNAMMELHSDFEDSSDDDDDDSEVGEPSFEGVTTIDNDDSVAANELPSSWVASPRNAATVAHLTTLS